MKRVKQILSYSKNVMKRVQSSEKENRSEQVKNRILLIIGLLLMVSTVEAKESKNTNDKWDYISYNHQRPITFNERGIKFYIYQNGEIDFKKPYPNAYYGASDYYYRNGKKIKKSKRNYHTNRYRSGNRIKVTYDYYGRVKSVGNVFIHYNYYDKVTNVGSVFMQYRRNRLTRVGGLQILRNRYGTTKYVGQVKPQQSYYNTGYYSFYNNYYYDDYVYDYEDDFFEDEFYINYEQFEEDDDYFYYRSKTKTSKRSKSGKTVSKPKMIKRKKSKRK